MSQAYFASLLEKQFYNKLEAMMFFNPQQGRISPDIIKSLDKFGEPRIEEEGDYLVVKVGDYPDVQTLFALFDDGEDIKLVGMLIYLRTSIEELYVLQIAIKEEWSINGPYADQNILGQMIGRLRGIAQRLRGINAIKLSYGGKDMKIPVRHNR
jgi:hypothetical protein